MTAVIEVRTYRTKQHCRDQLLDLLRTRAFPLHQRLGMKVLGPFPSHDDDDQFVWLRGFPTAESRDPMKEAFYGGAEWLNELEALAMPLIDDYQAVLVDDTYGLWTAWPSPRR